MAKIIVAVVLFALSVGRVACLETGDSRKDISVSLPYGPLPWGEVNFIHTTDSHGWLMGHQKASYPEPNYSGDLGDFYSFVKHMKDLAEETDVDLLLIDSGDLHDGTGLSDGFPPGGIDAHVSNQFFKKLPYDILSVGNHELYAYNVTMDVHKDFAPHWEGKYLTSNVNVTLSDGVSVPIGTRYRKFRTRKGRKVTAFGIMLDFGSNVAGTTIQKVEDLVKEAWFLDAIEEEPDFFLLVGHMPVAHNNWPTVRDAVRKVHSTTPIFIFGGHTHIRDCNQLDGRSMSMESGRFMETVGWMSTDFTKVPDTQNLTISRRYLDANRNTYQYHTGRHGYKFDTKLGRDISTGIQELANRWNLTESFGVSPQDYYFVWVPYPHNKSIYTLLINEVLPTVLKLGQPDRSTIPSKIIIDNGVIRYDIFAGPFTKNDELTASPYTDGFLYFNVPWSIGKQVFGKLMPKSARFDARQPDTVNSSHDAAQRILASHYTQQDNLTLGYVTQDACPGAGDDTLHKALTAYNLPEYVASPDPDVTDDEMVDLIFINFIVGRVASVLNALQTQHNYTSGEASPYSPYLVNEVFGMYAHIAWN